MELAATLAVILLLVLLLIGYHQLRCESQEARDELVNVVRHEVKRLETKVDTFTHANSRASILAEHAVASVERAERKKDAAPIVVVLPKQGPGRPM